MSKSGVVAVGNARDLSISGATAWMSAFSKPGSVARTCRREGGNCSRYGRSGLAFSLCLSCALLMAILGARSLPFHRTVRKCWSVKRMMHTMAPATEIWVVDTPSIWLDHMVKSASKTLEVLMKLVVEIDVGSIDYIFLRSWQSHVHPAKLPSIVYLHNHISRSEQSMFSCGKDIIRSNRPIICRSGSSSTALGLVVRPI